MRCALLVVGFVVVFGSVFASRARGGEAVRFGNISIQEALAQKVAKQKESTRSVEVILARPFKVGVNG